MTALSYFRKTWLFLAVVFIGSQAKAQNALDFDGTNDQVIVPAASALIANSPGMTMAFLGVPHQ
jgi:hypothetical protein